MAVAVMALMFVTVAYAQKETPKDPPPPGPVGQAGPDAPKAAPSPEAVAGKSTPPSPAASPATASSPAPNASPAAAVSPAPATVSTPAASREPAVAPPATAPAAPTANNWAPGFIGIIVLAFGIYYGVRYAQKKGLTVADGLKKMGVEMPQDGVGNTVPLQAAKPQPAPLPPLPSLSDLPAAGPASSAGIALAPSIGGVATSTANYRTGEPRLVGIAGPVQGETFLLGEPFSVGRDDGNSLALMQDTTLSRHHARVEKKNGKWVVTDDGSSNGTFVNNQRISGSTFLHPGDEIQTGSARFRFEGSG